MPDESAKVLPPAFPDGVAAELAGAARIVIAAILKPGELSDLIAFLQSRRAG
jgi:hypothetical protein